VDPEQEIPENERVPVQAAEPVQPQPVPTYRTYREERQRGYRSLFWPIMLIGAGAIALLVNLGYIESFSLGALLPYWPVLLIIAGLDVLLSRAAPAIGALLGLAAIAGLAALLIIAPPGGTSSNAWPFVIITDANVDVRTDTFSAPLNDAESADITLDFSSGTARVGAGAASGPLLQAEVTHVGDITLEDSGGTRRSVRLGSQPEFHFGFLNIRQDLPWDVQINPSVPVDLRIEASSGPATLDLSGLTLSGLSVDASSGPLVMQLAPGAYSLDYEASSGRTEISAPAGLDLEAFIDMSSGRFTLTLDEQTNAEIVLQDASSGHFTVQVPRGAAVRLDVRDSSSGRVIVPDELALVHGEGDDEGVWETAGYSGAAYQISIVAESMSSGDLIVEYR